MVGPALYYGVLLIIALMVLFNSIIFLLIFHKLTCKKNNLHCSSSKQNKMMSRLQNMLAISVLLGLTWVFGLLSIFESSSFVFQILFSIFNSLQGFFIFLLFVIRPVKIRNHLKSLITRKRERLLRKSSASDSRVKTSVSNISRVRDESMLKN